MVNILKPLAFATVLLFGIGYGSPMTEGLEKRAVAAAAKVAAADIFAARTAAATKAFHAAKLDTFEAAKANTLIATKAAAAKAATAAVAPFLVGRVGVLHKFI